MQDASHKETLRLHIHSFKQMKRNPELIEYEAHHCIETLNLTQQENSRVNNVG